MNTNEERRRYNDVVQERNRLERARRIEDGTEPTTGSRLLNIAEGLVTGILLGEFIDAMRD